jgi:hypothetical protein
MAQPATHYLALASNYWGKGRTMDEAKRQLRKQAGTIKGATIYEVPEDYWIDDYGTGHGSAPAKLIQGKDLRA